MKRAPRIVPEFTTRKRRTSAGFIPSYEEQEVELWQVWCRSATTGEERRATTADMRAAGYARKRRAR